MRHFAIQMHNNGNDGSALIFVRGMHGTGVAFAVHEQRVCLYCCVCDCIWRCYELVFDTVWGHDFAHMRHFVFCCPNALQWRWWLCVDLRLCDVWNGYWVGPEIKERRFLLLCLCYISSVVAIGIRCTMTLKAYPHHMLSKYTTMAMVILRWFAFAKRVVYWPWTNRLYVCVAICVCAWTWMH